MTRAGPMGLGMTLGVPLFLDHLLSPLEVLALGLLATALAQIGVRIVLDEFGVTNFSLLALRRLPIKAIKLDRSLLKHCANDVEYQVVMEAILATCKSFNLSVLV